MKLDELIEEAKIVNPLFKKTMEKKLKYGRVLNPSWLFKHLEKILGKAFVMKAAKAEIDRKMKEVDDTIRENSSAELQLGGSEIIKTESKEPEQTFAGTNR